MVPYWSQVRIAHCVTQEKKLSLSQDRLGSQVRASLVICTVKRYVPLIYFLTKINYNKAFIDQTYG